MKSGVIIATNNSTALQIVKRVHCFAVEYEGKTIAEVYDLEEAIDVALRHVKKYDLIFV